MHSLYLIAVVGISLITATLSAFAETPAEPTSQASNTKWNEWSASNAFDAKFNALFQGWSMIHQNTVANDQNFRLRRAEFKLSGQIAKLPKYFVMLDPAKLIPPPNGKAISADNMIQDLGIGLVLTPGLELTVGQFKTPTTAEGLDSSAELPLPERSLVGRTLGDRREMGIKLAYKDTLWNAMAMLSSGRSLSGVGQGWIHDLDLRVEVTPIAGLGLGAFAVAGNDFDYASKGRLGLNARYTTGSLALRAEYAQGLDGASHSQGLTTEAGYWVSENFQPIVRYEIYSPSQSIAVNGQAETLGFNYHIRNYFSKVQFAASALQNMAAANGSPVFSGGANNKELTLALQTAL